MNEFKPFKDRADHDFLNRMTRLIKEARDLTDQVQKTTEEYLKYAMEQRRKEDV